MTRLRSAHLRKSFADVTRRKGRTLLVVLGLFIGVAGLTTINVTDGTLVSAFAFTRGYQATQPDFQLTVDQLDTSLLPALQAISDVKAVQEVSTFSACWQPTNTGCSVDVNLFSAPDLQHLSITPVQLTAGRYPGVPGAGEIVMEQGDQSLHDVGIGDVVTLHVGDKAAQARVVGLARTPGADPHATRTALAYMSDAGLQQLVATLGNPAVTRRDGQPMPLLRHHIQATFRSSNPQVGIGADLRVEGERITPLDIEEALYRVSQEAPTNVARHSGATHAELQLTWDEEGLRLTVYDGGRGFDVAMAGGKGLVLASMHERIQASSGTLSLSSVPGETRVEVWIPLTATPAQEALLEVIHE